MVMMHWKCLRKEKSFDEVKKIVGGGLNKAFVNELPRNTEKAEKDYP